MRRFATLLLVLLCANGPPRCVETENFLSDPVASDMDAGLSGVWFGETALLSISRVDGDAPGVLRAVYMAFGNASTQPVHFATFRIWRTPVNGHQFLNFERIEEYAGGGPSKVPPRMIVRYERSDEGSMQLRLGNEEYSYRGSLRFWLMNHRTVTAAIAAGELEGYVIDGPKETRVVITAWRDALRAFIARNGTAQLFGKGDHGGGDPEPFVLLRASVRGAEGQK